MPELAWRLPVFLLVLGVLLLAEWRWPRRREAMRRGQRWLAHAGIAVVNSVALRLVFPGAAVGLALWAEQQGWGVLDMAAWPSALALLFSLLLLDLAIYAQHVATHYWPWLWRLHRMHHSDTVLDTSTALRFHPLEILLSMLWKAGVILSLGLPATAVLVYEVMLNAMALFNHANLRLPLSIERLLRYLLITPDVHRVHHSVYVAETNANFGNTLSLWDRLFGTWCEQPRDGHQSMQIGLLEWREARHSSLTGLLLQPWR